MKDTYRFQASPRLNKLEVLEKKLNGLKEEESKKQKLIDDITLQLWNLKSQVQ